MARTTRTTRTRRASAAATPDASATTDAPGTDVTDAPGTDAPAPVVTCRIIRPTARGDWYATLDVAAFAAADVPTDGGYVSVVSGAATVRFGGRGGAMIAATPDDGGRATLVVASVVAAREWDAAGRKNDARPGAIASPAVAIGMRVARDASDAARVRATFGRIAASRRVSAAPAIIRRAAETFGTDAPAAFAPAPAPDAPAPDAAPDAPDA